MSTQKVTRTDRANLKVIKTGEGFLKAEVIFAAPCVLPYYDDGKQKYEVKLPEEIFRPETIESAKGAVVCDGHPSVNGQRILITPENYFHFIKGNLSEPKTDSHNSKGLITIYDKTLIDEIVNKKKTQVSIGFTCDLEDTAGTYNGHKYDSIQRNILINHLAITDVARAGDATRILIDSFSQEELKMADELKTDAAAGQVDVSKATDAGKVDGADKSAAGEVKTYVYKTLDGSKELKIDSKDIFDELLDLNKKLKADAKADADIKQKTDSKSDFDALKTELIEMIDNKLKVVMPGMVEAKTKEKQDEMDKEQQKKDAETLETINLMRIVNRIMPELKTDSLNAKQIRIQVIQKGLPGKFRADMSDDQINATFEAALEVMRIKANQFDSSAKVFDDKSLQSQIEENKIKRNSVWGK